MTTTAQPSNHRLFRALCALVAIALAASLLLRLSAYGIWDPWELSVADAARKLGEGTATNLEQRSFALRLVQASFGIFGTREWAGRLPIALSGLALLVAVGLWVRRYAGNRAAIYAALVLGTTPLFLLNSRGMVGAAPAFLASALVTIGASNAVFPGLTLAKRSYEPWLWLLLAAVGALLGTITSGALLTTLPALAAVSCTVLLTGALLDRELARERRVAAWLTIAATLAVGLLVTRTIFAHGAEYSVWTGGAPLDPAVPTFERVIAHLFHGLAPWSAAAPVAIAALLWRAPTQPSGTPLRVVCALWAAFALGAATVFLSAYGVAPYPAPAAITVAIALWLSDLEDRSDSFWFELVVVLLMLGLLIRDFALYPASPYDGLELVNATAPDKFNPKLDWSLVLGAFGVALVLSCIATPTRGALDFKAPYRGLRDTWKLSWGHRGWLICFALLWIALIVFGAISVIQPPGVRLTSIVRRVGRVAGAVALLAPVALAATQWLYHESRRLSRVRNVPLVIAALAAGLYTSQIFLPKLSAHFSPREVFDVLETLASDDEPLAQFQVPGRAAAYYVQRDVRDLTTEADLVNYLAEPGRRWALLPTERLADVDVAFRRRTNRHLYLPSVENARVSLVASEPVKGRADRNPLALYVLKTPKPVQHPLNVNFEGKIELIGYDLELPQKDFVGPGQTFIVAWVYRALQSNLGAYQAFLHVDAEGQRINGDHDPVDGMYPVRLWTEGDVIVDRQRVSVPATNPPGTYTMYTGFFRGDSRLKISSGPNDGTDRVNAGTIQIR
jgi:hypothetical protein